MTWLALSDAELGLFPDAGPPLPLSMCFEKNAPGDATLETGSLFLEAEIGRNANHDQPLCVLHHKTDITSHVSVHLCADGAIVFARRLGSQHQQVTLRSDAPYTDGLLRLTISWNSAARYGLLSAELVRDGMLLQKGFANPLPWLNSDIALLRQPGRGVAFGPALRCFGVSDRFEPVGITPSLATGTPVLTKSGYRGIETLCPDDSIVTADGVLRQVRRVCTREVPARGQFCPIRLYAPYLGLMQDVVVAPEQRILVRGAEVEYLFNEEAVLVEARALRHTNFTEPQPVDRTIRYHQIVLDEHAMLQVAGASMESLFVGGLRDNPDMLATTVLADMPVSHLPNHRKLAYPALRDYEAATLKAALLNR